ncbi:hypothetical protein LZ554_004827 [Drepanopeziza brunnea f. sp. 'monogermtubi']|nr:hypothetical protein LZ554_004827 [Drepanopeziza brunnea f. sp. 'monogermtubi']
MTSRKFFITSGQGNGHHPKQLRNVEVRCPPLSTYMRYQKPFAALMYPSGHLENAHPSAGPLAQFDKTSRRYQQFLNYKPPPYVSPWASSSGSGSNVPSTTQPASKPADTPLQAPRVPQTLRNGVDILAYGSLAVN